MKPIWINKEGTLIEGVLSGTKGKVVAFDSMQDAVRIKLDYLTTIETNSENVKQENIERNDINVVD